VIVLLLGVWIKDGRSGKRPAQQLADASEQSPVVSEKQEVNSEQS